MRILLIEDDQVVRQSLTNYLAKNSAEVVAGNNLGFALKNIGEQEFDCLIIDINLPDGNGFELCQRLRQDNIDTPVLLISIRTQTTDKVQGLNIGADDYLTKPFDFDELLARVHSLVRRSVNSERINYQTRNFTFDPWKNRLIIQGRNIELTRFEARLLDLLIRAKNRPLSRSEIWDKLYGDDYPLTNSIDVIIARLRRKIKNSPYLSISTVRGVGYQVNFS